MTDIVERLNDAHFDGLSPEGQSKTLQDAIAEITRLRTELEQLRAIAGKATAEGQSFADIKRETRR